MEQWDYPYQVHKVQLPGNFNLAYIDEGLGDEVLLFIHGLGSNIKGWKKNIDELKEYYRCVAVDLPGYGKSSKGDYPFGMLFFVEVLQSFIAELDLKDVTVVGHSMGGQIALKWIIQGGQAIERVILLAPAGLELFTNAEKGRIISITKPQMLESLSVNQINYNFKVNFCTMPEDALFMIEDRLLLVEDPEYAHFCNMVSTCIIGMLEDPVMDDLHKVRVPALIMYGKEDQLIPNQLLHPQLTTDLIAEMGQKEMPNCNLKMIDQAGHFLQWEQSKRVNKEIIYFIRSSK